MIQLIERLKDRKNKRCRNFNIEQLLWIIFHYMFILIKKRKDMIIIIFCFFQKINIHFIC